MEAKMQVNIADCKTKMLIQCDVFAPSSAQHQCLIVLLCMHLVPSTFLHKSSHQRELCNEDDGIEYASSGRC
eukprot:5980004-Amphidinium_carterae.1